MADGERQRFPEEHPTKRPTQEQIEDAASQRAIAYINKAGDCVYRRE